MLNKWYNRELHGDEEARKIYESLSPPDTRPLHSHAGNILCLSLFFKIRQIDRQAETTKKICVWACEEDNNHHNNKPVSTGEKKKKKMHLGATLKTKTR